MRPKDAVDYTRQTADEPARQNSQLEDDDAERIARIMQRDNPYFTFWHDPAKRAEFVEGLREALNGGPGPEKEKAQVEARDENELPDDPLSKDGVEKWNRSRKKL
jgi:hypothetical protein